MKKLILFLSTLLFLSFSQAEDRADLIKDPSFNYYKVFVSGFLNPYWLKSLKEYGEVIWDKEHTLNHEQCQTIASLAASVELGIILDSRKWDRKTSPEEAFNFFNYLSSYFYDQVKAESKQAVIISKRQIELRKKLKDKERVFADQAISDLKEKLSGTHCKAYLIPKKYKDDSLKFFLESEDFLRKL